MSEPTTAAGRAFFAEMKELGLAHAMNGSAGVAILAIEREAALDALRQMTLAIQTLRRLAPDADLADALNILRAATQ